MNELLIIDQKNQIPLIDSRVVASELGVEHESLLRLFKERSEIGVEYSDLKSEKSGKRGQPTKYALLTEQQFVLLVTMVKNTDEAVTAKQKLVRLFFAMREALQDKRLSKIMRRELTDVIQEAKALGRIDMHGHEYGNFTDLIYRNSVGMSAKQYRESHGLDKDANAKERMTTEEVAKVTKMDELVKSLLANGFDYQQIKEILEKRALLKKEAA